MIKSNIEMSFFSLFLSLEENKNKKEKVINYHNDINKKREKEGRL